MIVVVNYAKVSIVDKYISYLFLFYVADCLAAFIKFTKTVHLLIIIIIGLA